jgi:CO/xanthine dehydrogenase Mo-binding subunit
MAEAMGMDALAFRRRNLLARGEAVRPGVAPMDADLVGDLDRVVASMRDGAPTGEGSGTGTGYAVGVADSGAGPGSVALIRMIADGDFILMAGSTEVGQGVRTVLCQIAAEELAVPLERVTMGGTDTSTTPFDRSTGASRSTTVMGTAVRAAAAELRCQLLAIGAELFEVALGEVTVERGELVAGGRRMTYAKALHAHFGVRGGELLGRGYCRVGGGLPTAKPLFWETGVAGARVRVDPETGRITLLRLASLADVGKAINPVQCEGQDEGAVMMGIGHALVEELVYEDGQPLNPNLVDYRVPSFEDLPDEFETILVENGDGPGPYGAKGMGEGGIVSPAPAIANALASATGVRIKELPLTPERVWWALRERDS